MYLNLLKFYVQRQHYSECKIPHPLFHGRAETPHLSYLIINDQLYNMIPVKNKEV